MYLLDIAALAICKGPAAFSPGSQAVHIEHVTWRADNGDCFQFSSNETEVQQPSPHRRVM